MALLSSNILPYSYFRSSSSLNSSTVNPAPSKMVFSVLRLTVTPR